MARQVARKVAQVSVFNIFSGFFCKTPTSRDQIQGFSLSSMERKQPSPLRQRHRERRKAIAGFHMTSLKVKLQNYRSY